MKTFYKIFWRRFLPKIVIWCGILSSLNQVYGDDESLSTHLSSGEAFDFAVIKYDGGTWDIAAHEQNSHIRLFIPTFLRWLKTTHKIPVSDKPAVITLSDQRIFNFPLLFINGHFRFKITQRETENLREYILRGGFLYIEDCGGTTHTHMLYGSFAEQIREVLHEIFPEGEIRVLPADHDIYATPHSFPNGLPNICGAENDNSDPATPGKKRKGHGGEGFYFRNTMVAFYSDADCCCGWANTIPGSDDAFKMGANIMVYAMTHRGM